MESVGSFSVNLLMYDADEYLAVKSYQNSRCGVSKVASNVESFSSSVSAEEVAENELDGSESGEEIDVFEDDDSHDESSLTSRRKSTVAARPPISTPAASPMNKPQFIVEGSFMAATSLFNLQKFDDNEEECSSSSSSNTSTASETFGRSLDEDGLITINEDTSVSTFHQQWKKYLR